MAGVPATTTDRTDGVVRAPASTAAVPPTLAAKARAGSRNAADTRVEPARWTTTSGAHSAMTAPSRATSPR